MLNNRDINYKFLKSALTSEGVLITNNEIVDWLKVRNDEVKVNVIKTPILELNSWNYDGNRLYHESGKFFSIDGIRIKTNWGNIESWDQPIINQPEIGYLGFIVKEFKGVLHFLMQGKIEPGNVNYVQLSPTLQATRSNYTQVHKGKQPTYLEYFIRAKAEHILLDQLQSEQGARFLKKRNRNIIIYVNEEIILEDNFIWLTLGQIKHLMRFNNLVNMDTRTVISGIPLGSFDDEVIDLFNNLSFMREKSYMSKAFMHSALTIGHNVHSIDSIIRFLTNIKSKYDLWVERIPLNKINQWNVNEWDISHVENKYFKVIGVEVEIENREVVRWSQPMVQPTQDGLCAFLCKEIKGTLHFAVQAKLECGNHDIIEFAPTVQCLTGNYRDVKESKLPFLDYVLNANDDKILFDTIQSEEGGRFFEEQNRNMIVLGGEDFPVELPEHFIWMTVNQLYTFLKFNNYLNIQARSLIAAISFLDYE